MKTEIILYFVIIQKMLKAGICKIFAELSYWRVFSFHTRPQCWSSCWLSGMVELLLSPQLTQCQWCQQAMVWLQNHCSDPFIFPSWPAPKYISKPKWKRLVENECKNGPSFVHFIIFFFPHVAVRLSRIAPAHKEYFWFLHDIFYAHYRGKKFQFSLDEQSSSKWRLFLTACFFWLSFCM